MNDFDKLMLKLVFDTIDVLSDDARRLLWDQLHERFCRHCGSRHTEKHPVCHCENDE